MTRILDGDETPSAPAALRPTPFGLGIIRGTVFSRD
jgi:hypothetical protein